MIVLSRYSSRFLLVQEFLREHPELAATSAGTRLIGELAAQYWVLRRLSLAVARAIDAGETPAAEAALIKEMGTRFEQDVVRALRGVVGPRAGGAAPMPHVVVRTVATSRRTGRAVIHHQGRHHRGAALRRRQRVVMSDSELRCRAAKLFDEHSGWQNVGDAEATGWADGLWKALRQTGFEVMSPVPEELGGAGGSITDAVELLRAAGAHAAPVPLAEAGLVGGWLLASAGLALP